jgi:hypothetical protein
MSEKQFWISAAGAVVVVVAVALIITRCTF